MSRRKRPPRLGSRQYSTYSARKASIALSVQRYQSRAILGQINLNSYSFFQVMKGSPSSSEGALTSLRGDLPLRRQKTIQTGLPTMDRFLTHLGKTMHNNLLTLVRSCKVLFPSPYHANEQHSKELIALLAYFSLLS